MKAKTTQIAQENNGAIANTVTIENQSQETNADNSSQDTEITTEGEHSVNKILDPVPEPEVEKVEDGHTCLNDDNKVKSCVFKVEKPKLPKFSGDVREYVVFRADF